MHGYDERPNGLTVLLMLVGTLAFALLLLLLAGLFLVGVWMWAS